MSDEADTPPVPEPDSSAGSIEATAGAVAESTGWPGAAKGTAVVLAIVAVAALIAAIVGFSQASSSDDDASAAESDLAAAQQRAEAAEQERDDLAAQVADLEAAGDDLAAAQGQIDAVTSERDEAIAERDQLSTELDTANDELDTAKEELAVAQEQVEVLSSLFPIDLDSSLIPDDMPGNYNITFQEAYCEGLATCGTVPTPPAARVYFTEEQFLRIEVPEILDAGLFALEGSLYGITDSFTALPACGGAERRARVTITMYADNVSVDNEANRTVNDVNASITIDAPENGPDCPKVLVFYASNLVPID